MTCLRHPLSADVSAAPLMPLVALEAAVTPHHSKEADTHESDWGWACRPERRPAPASQWTQRAGSSQIPDLHTSLLPQGMRTAAESGVGEVPFLLTLPQHRPLAPHGTPRQAPAGQDGCADEGGAAPAVAWPSEATHHLLVLLQQRAGQVQLGAGIDRRQREPGGWRAHELHHGGLQRREGVGDAGLVPHREGDDLVGRKTHRTPRLSPHSTGSPWTHSAVLWNADGGDNPPQGLTTVQGYLDGRRVDLPAGALELPTNRTEPGLLQEEGQGMPCPGAPYKQDRTGPAPRGGSGDAVQLPRTGQHASGSCPLLGLPGVQSVTPCPDPQSACLWNGYKGHSCVLGLS